MSFTGMIFLIAGIPSVMVPVLSKITIWVFPTCSIAAPVLIIMLDFAALFIPLMIATGVANINGHGVATTSTARMVSILFVNNHPIKLITIVIGVNNTA